MNGPLAALRRTALVLLLGWGAASASVHAERVASVEVPQAAHAKSSAIVGLRLAGPGATIALPALDAARILAIQRENRATGMRALKLGVVRDAREAAQEAGRPEWHPVAGGMAAQWRVGVEGARALRVELSVAHAPPGSRVRFAPLAAPERAEELGLPASGALWSPVIGGDAALVELFTPGASASGVSVAVSRVADHIADPMERGFEKDATGATVAGSCEVDFACAAQADAALQRAGAAVARMTYVAEGSVWACTGTLLNSGDGSLVPYFLTAAHCVHDQDAASSVSTLWFYQESTCGSDAPPTAVQLPGGARLLVTDAARDTTLLRLNDTPPEGAVYAGWDSSAIDFGAASVGIHHPGGGVKKVSEGETTYNPADDFLRVTWSSGVTEGGSSGSGLFTAFAGTRRDYLLRGTLYGGVTACTGAPANAFDLYARFDRVWPELAPYLSAERPEANHTGLWWDPDEPGWGLSLDQQQGVVVATLFTYGPAGEPLWLSAPALSEQSSGTYGGPLYRATQTAPGVGTSASVTAQAVGTSSVSFAGPARAVLTYAVDGRTVTRSIVPMAFGPGGPPACRLEPGNHAADDNFQGQWWNPAQPGWGVTIADQGGVLFAVLFVYDASGAPMWLVAPAAARNADGGYSGALYRTSQPPSAGGGWTPPSSDAVGDIALRFADGASGVLEYSVGGRKVTSPIARFVVAATSASCH